MKEPIFFSNLSDDMHCLQACCLMILHSFGFPKTWDEVDKGTGYQDGLYSWTAAACLFLDQYIHRLKYFSKLNYKRFADFGEEYLREFWSAKPRWYANQKIHASPSFKREQGYARKIIEQGLFVWKEKFVTEDFVGFLGEGCWLVALVDSGVLEFGIENNEGHFVLLYGLGKDGNFLIHNPGLPPKKSMTVAQLSFLNAFQGELIVLPVS